MDSNMNRGAAVSGSMPLKALIIEDVEDDAALLVQSLKRCGFDLIWKRVDSFVDLIAALADSWDIVFSDYTMPGFDGKDALETVRDHDEDLPFIFVSGTIGEDRAVEAVKSGAQDYIIKGQFKRLPLAVNHALNDARLKRENRLAQEKIHELVNSDPLTSTASRGYFLETLMHALELAQVSGGMVGVFLVNIDNFRSINDRMSMKGGDTLIIELGERLTNAVAKEDTVARLYADQFAVVVPEISSDRQVPMIIQTLLDCFARPFSVNRYQKNVTGSIGYCLFPEDGIDLQELINNATLAQAQAKRVKGTSVARYETKSRQAFEKRVDLEAELERAIVRREFLLHYQPQVDTTSGLIVGAESLVRWHHPQNGWMSPMEFIPVAEESGLILPLGEEICRLACEQLANWIAADLPPMRLAVNISSQQFQHDGFADRLSAITEAFRLDPRWIELEITETALMNDPDSAFTTMTLLSRLGFSIALDDFGTGYSSLGYLDRFPIDTLKIDRSFTSALPADRRKGSIVHAIIAMAEKLNIKVIAEGIETASQLAFMEASGCDAVQGYFIARPSDAATITPMLMRGRVAQ